MFEKLRSITVGKAIIIGVVAVAGGVAIACAAYDAYADYKINKAKKLASKISEEETVE